MCFSFFAFLYLYTIIIKARRKFKQCYLKLSLKFAQSCKPDHNFSEDYKSNKTKLKEIDNKLFVPEVVYVN